MVFLSKTNRFYKKHKKTYTKLEFLIQFIRQLYFSLIKLSISTKKHKKTNITHDFLIQLIRKLYVSLVKQFFHKQIRKLVENLSFLIQFKTIH